MVPPAIICLIKMKHRVKKRIKNLIIRERERNKQGEKKRGMCEVEEISLVEKVKLCIVIVQAGKFDLSVYIHRMHIASA